MKEQCRKSMISSKQCKVRVIQNFHKFYFSFKHIWLDSPCDADHEYDLALFLKNCFREKKCKTVRRSKKCENFIFLKCWKKVFFLFCSSDFLGHIQILRMKLSLVILTRARSHITYPVQQFRRYHHSDCSA